MTIAAAGLLMALAAVSPLRPYVDHDRVLVVSAPTGADPELRRQDEAVAREKAGLAERDLVVIRAIGGLAKDDHGRSVDAAVVRHAVGLDGGRFGVVLIGKDGGVKLRRLTAIPAAEILEVIDAMPMRRDEMKRGG